MTKKETKFCIKEEEKKIFDSLKGNNLFVKKLICRISKNNRYYRYLLMKSFRYFNYYYNKKGKIIRKIFWGRKYGRYSLKLGCQINCSNIGAGFFFEHSPIVINKKCVIGTNLYCIGNNCIGGTSHGAPKIGNNVMLGYGAIVIGDIKIADGVRIGAGAIVTKSVEEENCTIVGINQRLNKK